MKKLSVWLGCFLFSGYLFAQNKAEEALQVFQKKYPVEKAFLQYNKEDYLAGDKLLFKAYVFSGYALTDISTNLYVELYDQQNSLLDKVIVPLVLGTGEGGFLLKKDWAEGVYYIRAYTRWMLNFDDRFPYLHEFLVYNPASAKKLASKPLSWSATVFPESGNLLAGVNNRVAIRLFSRGALPKTWKAKVFEKSKPENIVALTESFNKEIGRFEFVPVDGRHYSVELADGSGNKQFIDLPVAKTTGALLQTKQQNDSIFVKVIFRNSGNRKYKLIGQMYNQLVYRAVIPKKDSAIVASIPINKLTNGILHVTLFDEKEQPVAERMQFVSTYTSKSIDVLPDTFSTQARGYNHWTFKLDTVRFNTYTAFITDGTFSPFKEDILTSLWLTNNVSRRIYEPGWYFEKADILRQEALDALLISERWPWFQWQQILNNRYPSILYSPDNYLSYTGTVFLGRRLQLNKAVNLVYLLKDSSLIFQQLYTDSSGSFTINGARFVDTVRVYYSLDTKKAKANAIKIYFEQNNPFHKLKLPLPESKHALVPRQAADTLSTTLQQAILALANDNKINNRYKQLEEVIVRAKQQRAIDLLNKKLSSFGFQSGDEKIFDFINTQQSFAYLNVIDWVRSNVAGLSTIPAYRGGVISIYLDEMPVDVNTLRMVPMNDIAMVKLISNSGGAITGNGALLVYTKRGDSGKTFFNGMPSDQIIGYKITNANAFVDYSSDLYKLIESDERPYLYWNTQITPDEKGEGHIRFYNNDVTKKFKLTIIGFSADGTPVYMERFFSDGKASSEIP